MQGKKLLATVALSALLFTGCGIKSVQTIITVNDKKITQAQFDEIFKKQTKTGMIAQLGIDMNNGKNNFMYYLLQDRIVNELIVKELLSQEMAKRDIKVTKDDVDNAIKEIVDKVGSKENLETLLKQNGMTASDFRKDLTEEVKMKKLAESLGSSEVSDADAKKYYNENIKKFKYPDKVRASHILIAVDPQIIDEEIRSDKANEGLTDAQIKAKVNEEVKARESKANEVLAKVKQNPADFAKYAKEYSDDTATAVKGGELGFFAAQEMVPEFSKAAFALKPNTVSGLVKSQFGYHIIKVTDRMAAGQEPFEKVKNNIKGYLQNQKQIQMIDDLVESLKKNANIVYVKDEFNPEAIRKNIQTEVQQSANTAKDLKKETEEKIKTESKK